MVVAHAVPSDVQSTVASECRESELSSGSVVCPQVTPPSSEKYCACLLFPMLLEAAMICFGSLGLILMSDSLCGLSWSPEIFRFAPANGAAAALNAGAGGGCKS